MPCYYSEAWLLHNPALHQAIRAIEFSHIRTLTGQNCVIQTVLYSVLILRCVSFKLSCTLYFVLKLKFVLFKLSCTLYSHGVCALFSKEDNFYHHRCFNELME